MVKQDEELLSNISTRFEEMKNDRVPWETPIKECMEFVMPRRSVWEEDEEEGRTPPRVIYNSSASVSLKLQSDGFQGYMVTRNTPWFKLEFSSPELMEGYGAGDWLEYVERLIYQDLQRSNFYDQLAEFIPDGGCAGTAYMFFDDDISSGISRFSTRHPLECFIDQNHYGVVDTIYRSFWLTAKQVVQAFGENVHPSVIDKAKYSPRTKIQVLHAIEPRIDAIPNNPLPSAGNKPFGSFYIDLTNQYFMGNSGFDEFPFLVWRFAKNSFEKYGRSPAMDALAEIKMLNQMARTRINLGQMIADPPFNIPESMKGSEQLLPHGYNYYADKVGQIVPITLGQNYPISIDNETRVEQIIKDHYHTDFYALLSNARQNNRPMTAREVIELQGEKAAVLGSTIGTFESEVLEPLISRAYRVLLRRGTIPQAPESLARYAKGGVININYIGPLAQAQKKYLQTSGIFQGLEAIAPIIQLFPDTLIRIDSDALMKSALQGTGMPANIIREDADVKAILEQIQAQKQQEQQMALQMQQSQALMQNADKLNQPVQEGSMLQNMGREAKKAQGQQEQAG